tara:strand:- start:4066 stop:4515 length:450 start_codon:yes stop_codon:yes gene_type:complete
MIGRSVLVSETKYIDSELMEQMCHSMAVRFFDEKLEPIASFKSHDQALLHSALELSKSMFGGKELYPTLVKKAAALYYSLIKNHPFENGNKRIATTTLLVFLKINDYWLKVGTEKLAQKALVVSKSDPKDRDTVLNELENLIQITITPF